MPSNHLPLQLQLSGVQVHLSNWKKFPIFYDKRIFKCPGYKRDAAGNYAPEPFAREAKFFLEQAILHRDVMYSNICLFVELVFLFFNNFIFECILA